MRKMGRKVSAQENRKNVSALGKRRKVSVRKMGRNVAKKIHQSWFVVALCIGIVLGAILGLVFRISFFDSWIWIVAAGLVCVVCYFQPRAFLLIFAVGAGMVLALFKCSSELSGEDYIGQLAGKTVTVAGIIDGDPETEDGKTKFKLNDLVFGKGAGIGKSEKEGIAEMNIQKEGSSEEKIEGEGQKEESGEEGSGEGGTEEGQKNVRSFATKGNIYVSMSSNEKLARGDKIVLSVKMSEGFGTYAGFLSRPNVVSWERPSPGNWVMNVRNWFAERVRAGVPETEANLGLSYLLGMKSGLDDSLSENLRTVGLTHIVVASGAHLSILVEIAKKIFGRASKFMGVGVSMIFVVFFMALVGWTPSIMRAGFMSVLKILADTVGRKFAAWRLILLVAAGTLLINPMYLTNLGWLLSFASFGGIMVLGPALAKFFYGEKKPKFIASTVLTTLAATLMTLPIILYYFGAVSLISVLPNMVILPTLPYVMGAVFLSGVFSGVPYVEMALSFIATKMLDFHIGVVAFFGQMKSFLVEIPTEQTWLFALYVVIVVPLAVGWGWRMWKKRKGKDQMALDLTTME